MICLERWNVGIMECWKDGTFEQTCLRKPHEQVVGRIVGASKPLTGFQYQLPFRRFLTPKVI